MALLNCKRASARGSAGGGDGTGTGDGDGSGLGEGDGDGSGLGEAGGSGEISGDGGSGLMSGEGTSGTSGLGTGSPPGGGEATSIVPWACTVWGRNRANARSTGTRILKDMTIGRDGETWRSGMRRSVLQRRGGESSG